MFSHNKRLQYTVRVGETNPGLANLMLEQFGGPQGELAAACRYFTQALGEDDPGRKDMLMDIATEELSHLEVIGTIVATLNNGAKGRLAEGVESEAELYRAISGAGDDSHVTQVPYGGGPPLVNSAVVPWTAAYIDTIGEPTADLRSNIAAEASGSDCGNPDCRKGQRCHILLSGLTRRCPRSNRVRCAACRASRAAASGVTRAPICANPGSATGIAAAT